MGTEWLEFMLGRLIQFVEGRKRVLSKGFSLEGRESSGFGVPRAFERLESAFPRHTLGFISVLIWVIVIA